MQNGHTHHIPICLNEGWKCEHRQTLPTQMNNKIVLILEVGTADKDTKKKQQQTKENILNTQNLLHAALDKTCPRKNEFSANNYQLKCLSFTSLWKLYRLIIKINGIIKTIDLNTLMEPL